MSDGTSSAATADSTVFQRVLGTLVTGYQHGRFEELSDEIAETPKDAFVVGPASGDLKQLYCVFIMLAQEHNRLTATVEVMMAKEPKTAQEHNDRHARLVPIRAEIKMYKLVYGFVSDLIWELMLLESSRFCETKPEHIVDIAVSRQGNIVGLDQMQVAMGQADKFLEGLAAMFSDVIVVNSEESSGEGSAGVCECGNPNCPGSLIRRNASRSDDGRDAEKKKGGSSPDVGLGASGGVESPVGGDTVGDDSNPW